MTDPRTAKPPAVVLLSGGLDSATTAAIAIADGFDVHALSFDYGQRHRQELTAAAAVARSLRIADHRVATIDLRAFGCSALTADIDVPKDRDPDHLGNDIPVTYVPARNTIFLAYALALAEVLDARDIYIGVNAVDYSGYPDCRPQYIEAFEKMANLATRSGVEGRKVRIRTPLVQQKKSEIIGHGLALGVNYALTHSCYDPRPNGSPCGRCDSCLIRAAAFRDLGLNDPLLSTTG